MSEYNNYEDEEERTVSFDELEEDDLLEDENSDPDDWGDEYDDMDSGSWEKHYGLEEEEIEGDPWDLN